MPQELRISARDGRPLAATLFAATTPRAVVVVAATMGVPRRVYAGPAQLGVKRIGHFGAFKPAFRDTLWTAWRDTLLAPT